MKKNFDKLGIAAEARIAPRIKGGSAEGAQPLHATILPPLLGEGAGGEG
jgi:hypothetical protein